MHSVTCAKTVSTQSAKIGGRLAASTTQTYSDDHHNIIIQLQFQPAVQKEPPRHPGCQALVSQLPLKWGYDFSYILAAIKRKVTPKSVHDSMRRWTASGVRADMVSVVG